MSEVGANQTQLILLGCLAGLFLGIFGSWRYNEAYYPFCRSQEEYCEMAKYVSALKNFQTKIDNGLIEDRFIVEARSKPTRNDIIAETVRNISFIRSELVQAKKLKASNNAEELAGHAQWVYRFGKQMVQIEQEISEHRLSEKESGFRIADRKAIQAETYRQTLHWATVMLQKKRFTNRCLWEGRNGCFNDQNSISQMIIALNQQIKELQQ